MKWKVSPAAPAEHLSKYPHIPQLLAQLLYNRGVTDPENAEVFLAADERLQNDPHLLPDMDKAVARIMRAVSGREITAVFGDFDADGVTSAALLVQGIERLGGKVIPYIPHRVEEGHGLNSKALQGLRQRGVRLVVTVDCGITANAEAREALQLGLDLVITDHHEVVGEIPQAVAVVNPKRPDSSYPVNPKRPDSSYPCRELAGVGVAYKLLQALFMATGRADESENFLDLVALGTVADMVPLLEESRYLVRRGIEVLNLTCSEGIRAMVNCAGRQIGELDAASISYAWAPRLNAAGRLDHADVSYRLLTTSSVREAQELAGLLDQRNAERQQLTSQFMALAEEKLLPVDPDLPLLLVADNGFHAGVNGVVAGKLTDKYYRPAIVVEITDGDAMGSARSIPEFNIVAALEECRDLLTRFGGHARAAGFGVSKENIEPLRKRLLEIAGRKLAGIDLQPTITIDAEVSLAQLSGSTFDLICQMEPFGQDNPQPIFLSRGVRVLDSRRVGADGTHVKFKLGDRGSVWDAIGFGLNHLNEDSPPLITISS